MDPSLPATLQACGAVLIVDGAYIATIDTGRGVAADAALAKCLATCYAARDAIEREAAGRTNCPCPTEQIP